jgi:CubicO group peptidase (beta-lactamase class C family)
MTKAVTAVAVMMLQEEGRLQLTDPAQRDHVGPTLEQLGDNLPAEETGPSRDEHAPV